MKKRRPFKAAYIRIVVLAILFFAVTGCLQIQPVPAFADQKLTSPKVEKKKVLKSKKEAAKAAAKALKSGEYDRYTYSGGPYDKVFRRLLLQHPEYNYDTSVWRNTDGTYGYKRSVFLTKEQQAAKMEEADKAASEAVRLCIRPWMSDQQKARAIHDYIIHNCEYGIIEDSFTAYGALVNRSAACKGYAAAFNLMAAKCGLQSMAVCGTSLGGDHAWNYVKLGNVYRYIDCTWDDTGILGNGVAYTYFNVTEEMMQKEHSWNQEEYSSDDLKYLKYFESY